MLSAKTFDCDHNFRAVGGMDTCVVQVVDDVGCNAHVGAAVLRGCPEGDTQSLRSYSGGKHDLILEGSDGQQDMWLYSLQHTSHFIYILLLVLWLFLLCCPQNEFEMSVFFIIQGLSYQNKTANFTIFRVCIH